HGVHHAAHGPAPAQRPRAQLGGEAGPVVVAAGHYCLGGALARLEIRVLFEELLPRLSSIELAGEVRRIRSNFVNGIRELPVRCSPGAP
ncbi:hypothetical protein ACWCSD_35180, partial [Nonomuraea sp. NPDC001684]